MSRSIRTKIPGEIGYFKPKAIKFYVYKTKIDRIAKYYNKNTKILKFLDIGN